MYGIRIVKRVDDASTEHDGKWIRLYDPSYSGAGPYDGGALETTDNPSSAITFTSPVGALAFWNTIAPRPFSVREDGEPNRPLTAFTVEIAPL